MLRHATTDRIFMAAWNTHAGPGNKGQTASLPLPPGMLQRRQRSQPAAQERPPLQHRRQDDASRLAQGTRGSAANHCAAGLLAQRPFVRSPRLQALCTCQCDYNCIAEPKPQARLKE